MPEAAALTRDDAIAVVGASLSHLIRLIGPNGRFVYAHPLDAPDRALDGYNLLRHCGTLWFMLRAVNDGGLPVTPGDCAALGLAARLVRPAWIGEPSLALVTKGAVKTGGIGLMLVMLKEYRRALPQGLDPAVWPEGIDPTIAGLQTYALAQIAGADFLHKRLIADGTVLPFRSDYYTGEVLLGLLATGATDPRIRGVTEALIARRYGVAEQSHWMAYAACEAAERGLVGRATVTAYLVDLMQGIVTDNSYRARAQSTPIACRSEALTRFLQLCAAWPGHFPEALCAAVERAARENLVLQLGWYSKGQFWRGEGDLKVQIDYIQHNATAFLNLWQLGLGVSPQRGN